MIIGDFIRRVMRQAVSHNQVKLAPKRRAGIATLSGVDMKEAQRRAAPVLHERDMREKARQAAAEREKVKEEEKEREEWLVWKKNLEEQRQAAVRSVSTSPDRDGSPSPVRGRRTWHVAARRSGLMARRSGRTTAGTFA